MLSTVPNGVLNALLRGDPCSLSLLFYVAAHQRQAGRRTRVFISERQIGQAGRMSTTHVVHGCLFCSLPSISCSEAPSTKMARQRPAGRTEVSRCDWCLPLSLSLLEVSAWLSLDQKENRGAQKRGGGEWTCPNIDILTCQRPTHHIYTCKPCRRGSLSVAHGRRADVMHRGCPHLRLREGAHV